MSSTLNHQSTDADFDDLEVSQWTSSLAFDDTLHFSRKVVISKLCIAGLFRNRITALIPTVDRPSSNSAKHQYVQRPSSTSAKHPITDRPSSTSAECPITDRLSRTSAECLITDKPSSNSAECTNIERPSSILNHWA
jgi:hypothetical protein